MIICRYCGHDHQSTECVKKGQKTFCVKCKSKSHNVEGHFKFAPENQRHKRADINVIEATSFLEGAVSMDSDHTGNNFENTRILIDTGALIPTGVAISEYFFTNSLKGRVEELKQVCYKCGGDHGVRNCRLIVCRYCGHDHQSTECVKKGQKTFCVKCKSKSHNVEGHFKFAPDNLRQRRSDINVIEATSFLEGAVSMDSDHTGNNFENTKILIDTGALIPTGVAISEYFFTNVLRGRTEDLRPSNLGSANGASSNSTMETLGQLEVRIRFDNLSTIFSGSAVILKNLSLPRGAGF